MTLLKCENLTYSIGSRVLFKDVSFDVQPGDFVVIHGPSGRGKTSLLRCILGYEKNFNGRIDLSSEWSEVPQDLKLNPDLSAEENVSLGFISKMNFWKTFFSLPKKIKDKSAQLLKYMGLTNTRLETSKLSGGEQQRVAVARALVSNCPLIIADEPISKMDDELSYKILSLMKKEVCEKKGAVVCVLHNEKFIQQFATKTISV